MKPDARTRLLQVLTARVEPLGRRRELTGIYKRRRSGPVTIGISGIAGDMQGDVKHHGGPEKAIHHYAFDHYARWKAELAGRSACTFDAPGAFGENFSTLGVNEADVNVGDTYGVGTAVIQVSQARQPCWRLNVRFALEDMALRVQTSGRTGWYYRVLEPGAASEGDGLELLDRPNVDWPLSRLLHYLYVDRLNGEALREIAALPFLSESWRTLAMQRLNRLAVEDWARRLQTPPVA
jgi:MOSC domain-containing protein YiiM